MKKRTSNFTKLRAAGISQKMRFGISLLLLSPLLALADPIPGGYPNPPIPPGTSPPFVVFGSTSTSLWSAAYEPAGEIDPGIDYGHWFLGFAPAEPSITSYTAQFTFATSDPINAASFGLVGYFTDGIHGTHYDPNFPPIYTWDAAHEVETITVSLTQYNITEQISGVSFPVGAAPPQFKILSVTFGDIAAPEPATWMLTACGMLGLLLERLRPNCALNRPRNFIAGV